MNNKAKIQAVRYAVYAALMLALYVMQTTPAFLTFFGIKPNLVFPAAVVIAMLEGEFTGGLYGALAGVLCDTSAITLFGFNAIIALLACVLIGLAFIYLLRVTVLNFVWVLTSVLLVRALLDFLFNYVMWGYPGISILLTQRILPSVAYSVAVAPLVYYLYRWLAHKFDERLQA